MRDQSVVVVVLAHEHASVDVRDLADEKAFICWTGFEEEDGGAGVFGKAGGNDRASCSTYR